MLPPDLMVGKTLIDAQKDYVPVRVVNPSGGPRKVCSGTEVASCEPVKFMSCFPRKKRFVQHPHFLLHK